MQTNEPKAENKVVENENLKDFIFVPDNLFFFKSFEISSKTPSKKLLEVVITQIIENSPFPIEQLLWGYVQQHHKKNSWVWYAGLKDRIQGFLGDIPSDKHIMPCAALAILLADDNDNCWLSIENQTTIIIDGLPKLFLTEKCDDWDTIKSNMSAKCTVAPKYFVLKQISAHHTSDFRCFFESSSNDQSFSQEVLSIAEKKIWSADIRDKEILKQLKRQKTMLSFSNRGLKWVGYLLLITLLFQIGLTFGKTICAWKKRVVKRQTSIVKKIENKDFLVRQMQAMLEQEMRPFELLGLLNSYRPKNIYFVNATIDNAHNIIVEAVAETAMAVQTYAKDLEESGKFESVHLDNINASYQGTKFKLSCDFKENRGTYFLNLKESL